MSAEVRQDAWFWRLFATGLGFGLFAMGGLVLRLVVFPCMRIGQRDRDRRQHQARAAIAVAFRCLIGFMVRSRLLTIEFSGAERLGRPGQLIIANHPSLLDVVFLLGQVDGASCIVKHSLARNPFTRAPISSAGYITNRDGLEMFEDAVQALQDGQTLILFPEGTRTPVETLPSFHMGASGIALRGARVLTPVVIRMRPRALAKGEPWYRIPKQRMRYSIQVGEDIPLTGRERLSPPRARRQLNDQLHAYFEKELTKE